MAKNLRSSKKDATASVTSSKERIIPIQIEEDEQKNLSTPVAISLQTKKRDTKETQATILPENEITAVLTSDTSGGLISLNSCHQIGNAAGDSDELPERPTPPIYVPEKIILILDRSLDDNFTYFEQKSGKKYTPLNMLQHAIQMFVHNKHLISSEHEFALITLNENSTTWVHDFTNIPQDISASLATIKPCKPEDIFNMNCVFEEIVTHISLPNIVNTAVPFVVRAVFLYNRSYSIPVLKETLEIRNLLRSPLFMFDVVMTHEPPDADNHCNRIFDILQKIDPKGFSYSFAVARNSMDLHIAMGKTLGHSLQRPPQSVLNYDITAFKN